MWQDLDAYEDAYIDADTHKGKQEYKRYRRELCFEPLVAILNIPGVALDADESINAIDSAVPRSSSVRECIAFATVLQQITNAPGPADPAIDEVELFTHIAALHAEYAASLGLHDMPDKRAPVYVARETADAVFFTRMKPNGAVSTCVLMRTTSEAVLDMLRTLLCDFDAVAASLRNVLRWAAMFNLLGRGEYLYMEMDHEADRYRVTRLQRVAVRSVALHSLPNMVYQITAILGGKRPIANLPVSIDNLDRSVLDGADAPDVVPAADVDVLTYLVIFGYQNVPTIPNGVQISVCNVAALYKSTAALDAEYKTYCNPQCENPAGFTSSLFSRGMQIQSRIASVAGLMARRYSVGMSGHMFAKNMLLTAQSKGSRLDMANTIATLAQLDLRRGPGTFSDYIKAPERLDKTTQSVLEHVPLYMRTWHEFLPNVGRLRAVLTPS